MYTIFNYFIYSFVFTSNGYLIIIILILLIYAFSIQPLGKKTKNK